MKKILTLIICLLMVNIVAALDELEITVTAYNPETQNAQIQIKNIGNEDYYDVHMAIDTLQPVKIVGLLRQGNSIKIPEGVPPGKHTITISTAEGVTVTKEIDFPRSEKQRKEELEKEEIIKELTGKSEEKKTAERVYEPKKTSLKNILIPLIILVSFLLLLFFIFKRKR